jgi:hypothetical protein
MKTPLHSTPVSLLAVATCLSAAAAHAATLNIALNYNFNGIVHAGESGIPDFPGGYRSISDRGLDFTGGVPASPLLAPYSIVSSANTLDIVHLGNRNTVDVGGPGGGAFDAAPDGDDIGVQPSWLPAVNQSGPQTTSLGGGILLDGTSSASFLFQISNGGGSFDVVFVFEGGGSVTSTLSGVDWFNGDFAGTDSVDRGATGANNLKIEQGVVNLGASAGEVLKSITFQNRSNANAGYAIIAANVEGTAVPEPASALLVGLGGLLALRRRRGA